MAINRHLSVLLWNSALLSAFAAFVIPAQGQGPVIRHTDYQLDTTSSTPAPFRLVGVVLNQTEDWLDPREQFNNTTPFFLGGQAEVIFQAVNLDGTPFDPYPAQSGTADPLFGDHGGTFAWMGQNYGNLPFVPDPNIAYIDEAMAGLPGETRPVWYQELDRLGIWRPGVDPNAATTVRAGDLVEIRARVNGLSFQGKHNVNERHSIEATNDFDVVLLAKGFGLPQAMGIRLSALKDANNQAIFDPTRQTGGEFYQGARVQLQRVAFQNVPAGTPLTPETTYTVRDETGRTLEVYLGRNPGFAGGVVPAGSLNMVGIVDQKSLSGTDGYRLLVMERADLSLSGDFNADGLFNCADINGLTGAIVGGTGIADFDMDGDGQLTVSDRDAWLAAAGAVNLPSGQPYRLGDANLDGVVDGSDFGLWNGNKFTGSSAWCQGDFNVDGVVDGSDFGVWNANKFQSALRVVPEPTGVFLLLWALLAIVPRRTSLGSK